MSELDAVMARFADMQASWGPDTTPAQMSADVEALYIGFSEPSSAKIEQVDIGGLASEWITPDGCAHRAVLHLHGGGYSTGTPRGYRGLATAIGEAANAHVLTLGYRLVPDHVYPAQIEDAVKAYDWLIGQGFAPGEIAFSGDSAGGGLAVSVLLKLRDLGKPMPGCAVLLSPWLDLEAAGESYRTNVDKDPIATPDMVRAMGGAYGGDPADPLAAPLNADLGGLPPLQILSGGCEIFESDARTLMSHAERDGVSVMLIAEPDMVHVWPLFASVLSKGKTALGEIGRFIAAKTG